MFNNIGKKIKGLVKFLFAVATIASVVLGIVMINTGAEMWYGGESYIIAGVIVLIAGPILSWISSWMIYGFGELVDKVDRLERHIVSHEDICCVNTDGKDDSLSDSEIDKKIGKCEVRGKENVEKVAKCQVEGSANNIDLQEIYVQAIGKMKLGSGYNATRFYKEAITLFEEIIDYKDSFDKIKECREQINKLSK